jgi:hypothetical protein
LATFAFFGWSLSVAVETSAHVAMICFDLLRYCKSSRNPPQLQTATGTSQASPVLLREKVTNSIFIFIPHAAQNCESTERLEASSKKLLISSTRGLSVSAG